MGARVSVVRVRARVLELGVKVRLRFRVLELKAEVELRDRAKSRELRVKS